MILEEILEHKRAELALLRERVSLSVLQEMAASQPPAVSLSQALVSPSAVRVIAEVKRKSPSRGNLAPSIDPARLAALYADYGAAAVSVLTDEKFFSGSLDDLDAVRREVTLPVLRKDFILSEYQVLEARAHGADALLLIAGVLSRDDLSELLDYTHLLGMEALVEVHTEDELEIALDCAAHLIGINNRDLQTFTTDLDTTRRLAPLVPTGKVMVSESGIASRADLDSLRSLGVNAVLVGEALVSSPDPAALLRELTH